MNGTIARLRTAAMGLQDFMTSAGIGMDPDRMRRALEGAEWLGRTHPAIADALSESLDEAVRTAADTGNREYAAVCGDASVDGSTGPLDTIITTYGEFPNYADSVSRRVLTPLMAFGGGPNGLLHDPDPFAIANGNDIVFMLLCHRVIYWSPNRDSATTHAVGILRAILSPRFHETMIRMLTGLTDGLTGPVADVAAAVSRMHERSIHSRRVSTSGESDDGDDIRPLVTAVVGYLLLLHPRYDWWHADPTLIRQIDSFMDDDSPVDADSLAAATARMILATHASIGVRNGTPLPKGPTFEGFMHMDGTDPYGRESDKMDDRALVLVSRGEVEAVERNRPYPPVIMNERKWFLPLGGCSRGIDSPGREWALGIDYSDVMDITAIPADRVVAAVDAGVRRAAVGDTERAEGLTGPARLFAWRDDGSHVANALGLVAHIIGDAINVRDEDGLKSAVIIHLLFTAIYGDADENMDSLVIRRADMESIISNVVDGFPADFIRERLRAAARTDLTGIFVKTQESKQGDLRRYTTTVKGTGEKIELAPMERLLLIRREWR